MMGPVIAKSLSRLPRDSIVKLCLKWAQSDNATPYLLSNRNLLESDEEDYLHEPAESTTALKQLYGNLREQEHEKEGPSKRDIIDRIVDGDWRRGLSLQQLADIDFTNLEHNDTALRWSALKLVPLHVSEDSAASHPAKKRKVSRSTTQQPHYPSISPANFVANLKSHISPLVKAHYTLHRISSASQLVVLRLYIVPNTPFAPRSSNIPRNVGQATDSARVLYIALPDSCPYVYISLSGSTGSSSALKSKKGDTTSTAKIDIAATKRIIVESIPKALSKPQERWSLEHTKLTCRSLKSIGLLRGNGRPGTAGGCYSKFSEEYEWRPSVQEKSQQESKIRSQKNIAQAEPTPLTVSQPQLQPSASQSAHSSLVSVRFGEMATQSHAKLDHFYVTVNNIFAEPPTVNRSRGSKPIPKTRPKRKRRSLEDIEAGRDTPVEVADANEASFQAEADLETAAAQISLSFSGVDVFRGLKELADVDGGRYIDLDRLPSWATGEKGVSSLVI